MEILRESKSSSAWMVRKDGRVFEVFMHPFGDLESDAIEDATWLAVTDNMYDNEAISYILAQFISDFNILTLEDVKECRTDVKSTMQELVCVSTYVYSFANFVDTLMKRYDALTESQIELYRKVNLSAECKKIKDILNNGFIRVRMGSEYLTQTETPGALYFRISSNDGTDWYDTIMNFACNLHKYISTVTIETDRASTGRYEVYADHLSWDDFLMQKPVIMEALQRNR